MLNSEVFEKLLKIKIKYNDKAYLSDTMSGQHRIMSRQVKRCLRLGWRRWWHAPFFCRLGRSHTSINLPMVDEVVEQVGAGVAIEFQPRDIEMLFHDRSAFLLTIKCVVANGRRRPLCCNKLALPLAALLVTAVW